MNEYIIKNKDKDPECKELYDSMVNFETKKLNLMWEMEKKRIERLYPLERYFYLKLSLYFSAIIGLVAVLWYCVEQL